MGIDPTVNGAGLRARLRYPQLTQLEYLMKRCFPRLTGLVTTLLTMAVALNAQTDQARFTGTVSDPTGAVIGGASVKVINLKTNQERSFSSSEQGVYFAPGLLPSSYRLEASATGFSSRTVEGIELQIGQVRTVNFSLQPAGVTTEVTVSVGDLAEVDTSSARIGVNVSTREVKELPLNGRQISQLYLLAPGAQSAGGGTYDNIRFSGRANQQNSVRFDGIEGSSIIDASPGNLNGQTSSAFRLQASLETVQEFRVESSNYPAEYGTGTAGQISIITKSGGNDLHGSLFEYVRNSAFDARNFFDGLEKSPLALNQYGGSLGGRLIKDKLFFFGSYEGLRQRAGFNLVGQTPSANARQGLLAGGRTVVVDPAVRPLLGAYPVGIRPTANPDFDIAQILAKTKVNEDAGNIRLDYNVNEKYRAYLRWFRDDGTSTSPFDVSGSSFLSKATSQNMVLSVQQTLAATVINETKVGYNGPKTRTSGVAPIVAGADLSDKTINISGATVLVGIGGQGANAGISIPSGQVRASSATNGRGQPYTNYSLSFIDNLSWIRGNHNYKFGGEGRLMRIYTDRLGGTTYSFTNLENFLINNPSGAAINGDLSAPSPFNNGVTGNRLGKYESFSFYAQDEWKLTPELTVSYGLRYEYYTPMREDKNRVVLYNIVTGDLDAPGSRPFYQTSKLSLAPRLGIAYAPKALGGKTVLRVGAGYYYGPGQGEDLIQPIESDRVSFTLAGTAAKYPVDSLAAIKNFNLNTATGIGVRAYAPGYTVPEKVLSYTFGIQQTLPGQAVLSVAYVGSQGRNLFLRSIANKVVGTTMNATTGVGAVVREFGPRFGEIDYKTTGGTDHYDSLQSTINRRFSRGLTLGGQWTYAHSIGNTGGSNEAQTAHNPYNFGYDRGNNAFDVRHSMNATALYELPFGKGRRFGSAWGRASDAALGGWDIGGVVNARTGLPIDVRITRPDLVYVNSSTGQVFNSPVLVGGVPVTQAVINVPGGGATRDVRRPNVVAGVNPLITGADKTVYLNPAAFSTPAPGSFGNLGRGAIHGPGMSQMDLTLSKRFNLTERVNLQFRAEGYNVFNRANFDLPIGRLNNALGTASNQLQPGAPYNGSSAGAFGQIQGTVEKVVGLGASRQVQLSLRISF